MNNEFRYYKQPRIITEPKWKSYVVETIKPIFTPEQCQKIINMGHSLPKKTAHIGGKEGHVEDSKTRTSHISWIPFHKLEPMYRTLEESMQRVNRNHFGFEGMQLTEQAQYTEYPEGGFYNWHSDNDIEMKKEPPVRKISMTLLLSNENEFEGGGLELVSPGKKAKLTQGNAIFFASFISHRVAPVTRGVRKSLVVWFGGTPFK
jgi:PKHD-type hydroxylase|tara:strand:- start:1248 stop:1859 length:612 start_codon:yes stop_codon:yes gene_type:complete